MADLLDKTEASLLLSYEAVVEKGLDTFLEVGTALKAIADGRLYRERHKTFDAYLDARWNMTRSWASRLIQAAEVVEMLPIGNKLDVTSESQARELAKAPQGKRAETLVKAKESAKSQGREKPTAKDIREAVEQGNGMTPTHDATQQDAAEPRMADTDGDQLQQGDDDEGQVSRFDVSRNSQTTQRQHVDGWRSISQIGDSEHSRRATSNCPHGGHHQATREGGETFCKKCFEPLAEVEAEEAYDTSSLDDFCQWTIDQCEPLHREQLAERLQHWAKQARGVK